jgi:hypothetical protein
MTITLRTEKGSPLTFDELDGNFFELDSRLNQLEAAEVISVNGKSGEVLLTTSDISEGTNLYYTSNRFDNNFSTKNTDNLTEGINNLYFTTSRSRASLSAGTGINYSNVTGVISLSASTTNVSEGDNLYFTNARVDARIAVSTADDLLDVEYTTSPNPGDVLTWNPLNNVWEPSQPPGATGGEANTATNVGAGQGIFAVKVSQDLRFFTLAGSNGIGISSPVANVITISANQDTSTGSAVTFLSVVGGNLSIASNTLSSTNVDGNITLSPAGTGNVIISTTSAAQIFYAGSNKELTSSTNLTYNGSNVSLVGGLTVSANITSPKFISNVSTGTAPFEVLSTTQVANLNAATAGIAATVSSSTQPNITSLGNLTIANIDNIQIDQNTISTTNVNGNLNLTPNGTGNVVIATLAINDLTQNRIVYVNSSKKIIDNANLTFDGTTLTVLGNANVTTLNSNTINLTTINSGNIKVSNNTIESTNVNGNIILSPNGNGNIGIKKSNPTSALDVNGIITSTGLNATGLVTLGATASDSITLLGRLATNLVPLTTASYDLGSSSNKFRSVFLAGNLAVDGSIVLGDTSSDSLTITAGVNSSIIPSTTNSFDLGSSSVRWRDIYLSGDINFSGGDIITSTTTTNLINATSTTVNFAGAATTVISGATTGVAIYRNPIQIFGNSDTSATPAASTLRGTNGSGTDIVGANLIISAGQSTGSAVGGNLIFQTSGSAGSGASLNSPVTRLTINTEINAATSILPSANVTYNLGSTSLRWANIWGLSSSAQYADLAERYQADAIYDVGTVVIFGGNAEITTTNTKADVSVAGVVSENPAYLMNDTISNDEKFPAIALRGKVKVKCIGKVAKGDLLITSETPGYAVSTGKNDFGNAVFAKAISNKDDEGIPYVWAVII